MSADVPVMLNSGDALLSQAVASVAEGVGRTGAKAVLLKAGQPLPPCSGVILGLKGFDQAFLKQLSLNGLKIAILLVHAGKGKAELVEITRLLQDDGAKVENTLLLAPAGFLLKALGRGTLSESDLVRAAGFGERSANAFAGVKISRKSEKDRISGYKKD
ncbi:hypothetical protein AUJ14_05620 [Candidatus Micrarchaeota archaeon CG1_02_55_22]|nr:MAG: hypothetical protein AUJ14_05620 [Candidatus Micrarchaeota archaeon CG1_02_55_22]